MNPHHQQLPLSNCMTIPNQSHILYVYQDVDKYVDNLVGYIMTGIKFGHHILVVEDKVIYESAKEKLNQHIPQNGWDFVHYTDNFSFYGAHGTFHAKTIVKYYGELLQPLLDTQYTVRTWAHVAWRDQDDIVNKLDGFEGSADDKVTDVGIIAVCAYDASHTSATLQTALMRSHAFYMTDEEIVRSSLYPN